MVFITEYYKKKKSLLKLLMPRMTKYSVIALWSNPKRDTAFTRQVGAAAISD